MHLEGRGGIFTRGEEESMLTRGKEKNQGGEGGHVGSDLGN